MTVSDHMSAFPNSKHRPANAATAIRKRKGLLKMISDRAENDCTETHWERFAFHRIRLIAPPAANARNDSSAITGTGGEGT
jgi:hypothetical protein